MTKIESYGSPYKKLPANSRRLTGTGERLFVWFYDHAARCDFHQRRPWVIGLEDKSIRNSIFGGCAACRVDKYFSHL